MKLLCALGYEFHILDSAFLVHKPGVKHARQVHEKWRGPIVAAQNKLIKKVIMGEMLALYGKC